MPPALRFALLPRMLFLRYLHIFTMQGWQMTFVSAAHRAFGQR
jgi:hypothetical protein